MHRISQHKILLAGDSLAHCQDQVKKYFDLTSLVIYDCIEIPENKCISGLDTAFLRLIRKAENRNKDSVRELTAELEEAGFTNSRDLINIQQGYVSKVFHILSHFLDGFIGIDSYFFNLLDDSHWLPDSTETMIKDDPARYWLLHLDCFSMTPEEAGILHLSKS